MSTPKSTTPRAKRRRPGGPLANRALIDGNDADALTALFKVLANPHRLRLLHALAREGELPVGALADEVEMSVQAVSNQLQRLADQRILVARREGTRAYYRIIDPCVTGLLDLGVCLIEEHPPATPTGHAGS